MNGSKEEPPLDIEPAQVTTMEHEELLVPVIYSEPKSGESVSYVSMSLYRVGIDILLFCFYCSVYHFDISVLEN
jgi:hypothetical protein